MTGLRAPWALCLGSRRAHLFFGATICAGRAALLGAILPMLLERPSGTRAVVAMVLLRRALGAMLVSVPGVVARSLARVLLSCGLGTAHPRVLLSCDLGTARPWIITWS